MKTTRFLMIALVATGMFLMSLGNGLMAQRNGRGNGNGDCQQQRKDTYLSIPGLTASQKDKIANLQKEHRKTIDGYRDEKQSTRSAEQKSSIDTKMDAQIKKHKKEVRDQLTPDQQKYFDENCKNTRVHKNRGAKNGKGRGDGNCNPGGNNNGQGLRK